MNENDVKNRVRAALSRAADGLTEEAQALRMRDGVCRLSGDEAGCDPLAVPTALALEAAASLLRATTPGASLGDTVTTTQSTRRVHEEPSTKAGAKGKKLAGASDEDA